MHQQEIMHRHAQRVNEGMLVMVLLMLSSWRGAQSEGDDRGHLPREVHKVEAHMA
jgi:hypothetical protein